MTVLKNRIKKKSFWLTLIPAVLIVVQIVGSWFGVNIAVDVIGGEATKFINAVYDVVRSVMG